MHGTKLTLGVAVLLVSFPAIGRAAESSGLMSPFGEYILAGGGVSDFTKKELKDAYNLGATWNVRLGIGSRHFVGAEVAYVGVRRSASIGNNDILANGAEGVVRVQYPYATGAMLVEPFAFGGIGWSHVSIDNLPAGAKDTDEIGVVPVGAGVMVGFSRLLLDARFAYDFTFSDKELTGKSGDLKSWSVVGSIGYEF